ncbi:hypothetical protein O1611_g3180 [Lasiodiplodia mahajangana]|uniref:Uncharacterized protein n=1 Tax=Lasiodiplodia mahajangana TaxID=1108764 RepID=A0ACC2JSP8_9PEZI|nr:hypothetical protein O1611_g3180 [Lasiodiplodia mahajangana]
MPTSTDGFLALGRLLADNKFCCRTVAFADIYKALQITGNLPYTDQELQTVGFVCSATQETLVYYRKFTDVYDYVVTAGASVRNDYACVKDIIFDGLAGLIKDPDNESLQQQIHQTIRNRVETPRNLPDAKLGEMAKPLQGTSAISELLREADGDEEDYQQDMGGSAEPLKAAVAILSDMSWLLEEFENDARPGPDLVLNLEKNNLI